VDGIALSGGIGEHDQALAQELQEELAWLGAVRWLVVPADEEGLMVRLCMESRRTKA
jgi:acetate kinase